MAKISCRAGHAGGFKLAPKPPINSKMPNFVADEIDISLTSMISILEVDFDEEMRKNSLPMQTAIIRYVNINGKFYLLWKIPQGNLTVHTSCFRLLSSGFNVANVSGTLSIT